MQFPVLKKLIRVIAATEQNTISMDHGCVMSTKNSTKELLSRQRASQRDYVFITKDTK